MGEKKRAGAGESESGEHLSHLGEGLTLKGRLKFRGRATLHCDFSGEILSGEELIVSEFGNVKADIKVDSVKNAGDITGDIDAKSGVQILPGGKVTGNIKTPALKIEMGAVFSGKSEMPPPKKKAAVTDPVRIDEPVKKGGDASPLPEANERTGGASSPEKRESSWIAYGGVGALLALVLFWYYGGELSPPVDPVEKSSALKSELDEDATPPKGGVLTSSATPDHKVGEESELGIKPGQTIVGGLEDRDEIARQKAIKLEKALIEKKREEADRARRAEEKKKRSEELKIAKKKEAARVLAIKEASDAKLAAKIKREKAKKKAEKRRLELARVKEAKARKVKEAKALKKKASAEKRRVKLARGKKSGTGAKVKEPLKTTPSPEGALSSPGKNPVDKKMRVIPAKQPVVTAPVAGPSAVKSPGKPPETRVDKRPLPTPVLSKKQLDIQNYKKILKVDPKNPVVNLKLAQLYFAAGFEELAVGSFKKQEEIDPESIELMNNRGFTEFENKRYEKALNIFKQVVLTDTGNSRASYGILSVYARQNFFLQAINLAENTLRESPDLAPFQNKLAWLYGKRRVKLDQAISLSLKSLRENPSATEYLSTLATLYHQKGEKGRAIEIIEKAIKLSPETKLYKTQLWKFNNT